MKDRSVVQTDFSKTQKRSTPLEKDRHCNHPCNYPPQISSLCQKDITPSSASFHHLYPPILSYFFHMFWGCQKQFPALKDLLKGIFYFLPRQSTIFHHHLGYLFFFHPHRGHANPRISPATATRIDMMLAFIQNLGVLGSVPVPWPGTLRCTPSVASW